VSIFKTLFSLQYGPHFIKAAKHHPSREDVIAYSLCKLKPSDEANYRAWFLRGQHQSYDE